MSNARVLGLIVGVYVLLGIGYGLVVPLAEAPDELDHFHYIQTLQQQRLFPVMMPVADDNVTMEANQPPLYYLLNAALTAPWTVAEPTEFARNRCFTFDPHDGGRSHFYLHTALEENPLAPELLAFRLARLVSVLLSSLTVLLTYWLGRQLAPDRPAVGLWAAALLAFNPQFLFINASVNNDVLAACLGALLLCLTVDAARAPTTGRFAGLGMVMGLALLTKFGLLAFWPLTFTGVIMAAYRRRHRLALTGALMLGGLPLLVAGWWYARAWRLYGDPLAWTIHLQAKGEQVLRTAPLGWTDLLDFARIHFQSYWAWFGWLKIQPPGWVYLIVLALVLAGAVGLLAALRASWRGAEHRAWTPDRLALLLQGLAVAAIYLSLLRYIQTINWSGYQGRLAFAAAAPIAALLGLGWAELTTRRRERLLRAGVSSGLALLAAGCLFLVAARFPRSSLFLPPVGWARVCATGTGGLYVEALEAPRSAVAGETLTFRLGTEGGDEAPLTAALVNWEGSILAKALGTPDGGTDAVRLTRFAITIPPGTPPARAWLQLADAQGTRLTALKIAPAAPVVAVFDRPVDADFGGLLRLIGVTTTQEGGDLVVESAWQATATMTVDYTIFIHLLDAEGGLLAQADAQPQEGRYPTTIWDVGEVVVHRVVIPLPGDSEPAQVGLGLYDLATQDRLPLPDGNTAVLLPLAP